MSKKPSRLQKIKSKLPNWLRSPFIIGLIAFYSLAWSWTLFTDSLDLAGSKREGVIVAIFVLIVNVALSVTIVSKTFSRFKRATNAYNPLVVTALGLPIFAVMDFAVSWLTAIIWLGPQGSIDNILPLSSPTLLLINAPFAFASRLIGFYGLAAFFWLTLYLLLEKRLRRYAVVPIAVLTVLSLVGWQLFHTPNGSNFKATIVSETLTEHVQAIQPSDSKLVIFPEYGFDDIGQDNLSERIVSDPAKETAFFLGSQMVRNGLQAGHLNILLYGNTKTGFTFKQNKYRLIPGGEDLGYILRTLLRATNRRATLDYFSYAKMVIKGEHAIYPFHFDSTVVGAAVCSSIIAPQDYKNFAQEGATVFSNSASLTIFKGSPIFAFQQKSLARFMAIANSRYFLQSANAASAYALDNNGKQLAEVRGVQTVTVEAKNNTKKTLYTLTGEYILATGFVLVIMYLFQLVRNRAKASKKKKA